MLRLRREQDPGAPDMIALGDAPFVGIDEAYRRANDEDPDAS